MKSRILLLLLSAAITNSYAQWNTNGTHIYNANAGNVGIGTSSPEAPLDVKGRQIYLGTIPATLGYSGTEYPSVGYNTVYTNTAFNYTYKSNDNASLIYFGQGGFSFKSAEVGTPGSPISFTEVMSIKRNGNVGIGTTSPVSRLEISEGPGGEQLRISRGIGSVRFVQELGLDNLYLYNKDASKLYMFWKQDGNVGIGTTNPTQKLTVNGTIYGKEVKVDLNVPGPDYVFEPTYNLPSLTEIETYIKANKHLPEVPSAKEMEANGINLSEMNMLLLKKVEELTLHLIEAKKQLEKQQIQIDDLNKKVYEKR